MIRRAAIDDSLDIARVHVKSWQQIYRGHIPDAHLDNLDVTARAERWRKIIPQADGRTGVYLVSEQIVGFIHLCSARDLDSSADTGEVASIYLDPEYWRQGIGSELIVWAETQAKQRDWQELVLFVLDSNSQARAFYESTGWYDDEARKEDEIGGTRVVEVRYRKQLST